MVLIIVFLEPRRGPHCLSSPSVPPVYQWIIKGDIGESIALQVIRIHLVDKIRPIPGVPLGSRIGWIVVEGHRQVVEGRVDWILKAEHVEVVAKYCVLSRKRWIIVLL